MSYSQKEAKKASSFFTFYKAYSKAKLLKKADFSAK